MLRAEFRGLAYGAVVLAATTAVLTVIADPPDALGSFVAAVIGAFCGVAIVRAFAKSVPARYRTPQPWPPGGVRQATRRGVLASACQTWVSGLAVIGVFALTTSNVDTVFPGWTGLYLALGVSYWWRQQAVGEFEAALEITLYRDLATWRRPRGSRLGYAQPARAPSGP